MLQPVQIRDVQTVHTAATTAVVSPSISLVSTAMNIYITVQYYKSNSFYYFWNKRSGLRYPMPVDVRKRPTRLVSSASAIWSWQFRIILVGDSTVGKSALLKVLPEHCLLNDLTAIKVLNFSALRKDPSLKRAIQLSELTFSRV